MITEPALIASLQESWGLTGARVSVHNGGMGSQTWFVDLGDQRWVAKAVEAPDGGPLAGGLAIARRLEQAGIPAGAAVPGAGGQLCVPVAGNWLALLTWVPGQPLAGQDSREQDLIGATLARVHRALTGYEPAGAQRFHWVDPGADHLALRPWLRPVITAALQDLDAVRPDAMVQGMLHADPAPGAFRLDPATGRCGIIDWSYAQHGPLLYDLASAVMYVGGPASATALTSAYLREGIVGAAEIEHGLEPMLRFRWAVQANYFAWRIAVNNLTGISGPGENEKGLEDARRALVS